MLCDRLRPTVSDSAEEGRTRTAGLNDSRELSYQSRPPCRL